jgi:methyl-accepting chemotaxis protein
LHGDSICSKYLRRILREIITMSSANTEIVVLVIAGLVALALLLQGIVLLAIYLGARAALRTARKELDDFRAVALPLVKEGREFFIRVAPKMEETSVDLAAVVHTLRVETDQLQSAATQFVERASRQASRLDSMATAVLDAADRAAGFVSNAVNKPMRQLSGILASIKAVVETLRTPEPGTPAQTNHASGDPEMFV